MDTDCIKKCIYLYHKNHSSQKQNPIKEKPKHVSYRTHHTQGSDELD